MIEKILRAAKERTLVRKTKNKLYSTLRRICHVLIRRTYKFFPLQQDKIIFDNFAGRGFGDHPRYIAEEIHRRGLNWDMVWLVSDPETPAPDWLRKVKLESVRSLYDCATAKMWVDNVRNAHLLPKRRGQIYLQTWHGSTMCGYKKIEGEIESTLGKKYLTDAKYDGSITDGILSQCKSDSEKYRKFFWLSEQAEVLEFGGPREDFLFDHAYVNARSASLRRELGIAENEFVVLYAPTFRDSGDVNAYQLPFSAIRDVFSAKTNRPCRIMIRLHSIVSKNVSCFDFYRDCIDGSVLGDANDALIVSDALISDFSSILYEACLLKRPSFLCAIDYEAYTHSRELEPTPEDFPFEIYKSSEDLITGIQKTNFDTYWDEINAYLKTRHSYDDGHASSRTVDWLIKKQSSR